MQAGYNVKHLFRRVAAALPGMEEVNKGGAEDEHVVPLEPKAAGAGEEGKKEGGCAC